LNWICWRCGHYESNTPAFKSAPYLFKDLVRDDQEHFMRKYCSPTENKHNFSPTEFQQRNKTPDDETEPIFIIKIMTKQSQIFSRGCIFAFTRRLFKIVFYYMLCE
jgi:hypothetical protein